MREIEYEPLIAIGFKDINESDLHTEFVKPFNFGYERRNNLLINFGQFLNRFKELGLQAEVWIDGSFATKAPDPSDIDVVFYFIPAQVDALTEEKKDAFNILFSSRTFMKNLYNVEVFYGVIENEHDYKQWLSVFGTCYDNVTPKGIFRMVYN
jgi:predicted nucleotidyltransferase